MDVIREREHVVPFPPSTGAFQKGLKRRELSKAKASGAESSGEESSYLAYDVNNSRYQ